MQGRSVTHLDGRWRDLKFDSNTDDIEVFISNVKQTVYQLKHNDIVVLNLISACMLVDIYGNLYPVQELDVTTVIVKGIYPRKS